MQHIIQKQNPQKLSVYSASIRHQIRRYNYSLMFIYRVGAIVSTTNPSLISSHSAVDNKAT